MFFRRCEAWGADGPPRTPRAEVTVPRPLVGFYEQAGEDPYNAEWAQAFVAAFQARRG